MWAFYVGNIHLMQDKAVKEERNKKDTRHIENRSGRCKFSSIINNINVN